MRRNRYRTNLPRVELVEARTLLTTLIALIDTGVNENSINTPYLDMADAYNAVNGSNNVTDIATVGHGTEVSDFIAQEIQSTSTLSGLSPSVEILPIKDWDPTLNGGAGALSSNAIIAGIQYAISKGATVINLSYAGPGVTVNSSGETVTTAIENAEAVNAVTVIAAGNNGDDIGGMQYGNQDIDIEQPDGVYPAVLPHDVPLPNAVTVTSASSSGNLNSTMNYGAVHVNFAVPLPIPNFTYSDYDTSYAAGYASGVIGVLSALHPRV